jgi:hypothetical protein
MPLLAGVAWDASASELRVDMPTGLDVIRMERDAHFEVVVGVAPSTYSPSHRHAAGAFPQPGESLVSRLGRWPRPNEESQQAFWGDRSGEGSAVKRGHAN